MNAEVKKYVSNTDRDIYTVSNIPEEVIAVIFAYVSRSAKSFRDNIEVVIQEEQHGRERAAQFHEKWVLNYGHASVAEHAAVHVGIERVSRHFSSLLELSNEYLSFTEYSQRYQKPKKGDFYVPTELNSHPKLKEEFIGLNNDLYDIYAKINDELFVYLKDTQPVPDGAEEKAHFRALEKVAFEDARYALTLATFTNLGMTGNARAMEDSLTKLLSSSFEEVRTRAQEIKDEVRFSVPTLVKYANENEYIVKTREALPRIAPANGVDGSEAAGTRHVTLIDWTGKGAPDAEETALERIAGALLYENSGISYEAVNEELGRMSPEEKLAVFKKSVEKLGKYDNPVSALRLVGYTAEFVISEACWHQLLRHRKTDWFFQDPSVSHGVTVPPNVQGAGVTELLLKAAGASEGIYSKFIGEGLTESAVYAVTNAHNRRALGSFTLWELYHLVNLRMSEGAQWDIKNVTATLAAEVGRRHPNLVAPALKRVK